MRYVALEDGDRIVLDIGHSGGVSGIAVVGKSIVSGADDGFVYVRGEDGRSEVAPAHVPAVSCVLHIPGTTKCLIGTRGVAFAMDVATGATAAMRGLHESPATTGAVAGDLAVLGCLDGALRSIRADGTVETLASFDVPVAHLAASDDLLAVVLVSGDLIALEPDGRERWRAEHVPSELQHVAVLDTSVVTSGPDPDGSGVETLLRQFGPDGQPTQQRPTGVPVTALGSAFDGVVVALGNGQVLRYPSGLDAEPEHVGTVPDVSIETLHVDIDGVWYGGSGGEVGRVTPALALPQIDGGYYGMSMLSDDQVLASDILGISVLDLASGQEMDRLSLPAVVALTVAADGTGDLVTARVDGVVQRHAGARWDQLVSEVTFDERARELGTLGRDVIAVSESGDCLRLTGTELEPAPATDEDLERAKIMRREGAGFVARPDEALRVFPVDHDDLVVVRDGKAAVSDGAVAVFAIARGSTLRRFAD